MEVNCAYCGQRIERYLCPAMIARRKHVFCNKKCDRAYFKEHWKESVLSNKKPKLDNRRYIVKTLNPLQVKTECTQSRTECVNCRDMFDNFCRFNYWRSPC